jgi:hypothetical protein
MGVVVVVVLKEEEVVVVVLKEEEVVVVVLKEEVVVVARSSRYHQENLKQKGEREYS